MDDRIRAALDAGFPDREVGSVEAAGPSWNAATVTVKVTFADDTARFLKVAADGDGDRMVREDAAIAYAGATTAVPVPEVVAVDGDADPPYLATAPVDGTNFIDVQPDGDAEKRALYRAFGRALARVHGRRFDSHGHVAGGGADGLTLDRAPWSAVLADYVEWLRRVSTADRFDDHFDRVGRAVRAASDLLDDAPAALLHGDPSRPNVYRVADGRLGFLDWEMAVVGDPVRELVRVREQQLEPDRGAPHEALLTAFHDGYRDVAGSLPAGYDDRRPVYRAVQLLGTSGYFDKQVAFTDADEEAFADWLTAEMDDRLAALP